MKNPIITGVISILVIGAIITVFATSITGSTTVDTDETLRIQVLESLKSAGAELYTLPTCGHCKEQKELLGEDYASYVKEIDCSQVKCGNLSGVPTWIINGKTYEGFKTLKELKTILGI